MKRLLQITSAILLILALHTVAHASSFVVTYRSLELVYIDGGRNDGLSVGDRGEIRRDDQIIAELDIAHIAAHSASCRIISQSGEIVVGDTVSISVSIPKPDVQDTVSQASSGFRDSPRWSPKSVGRQNDRPVVDASVGLRVSHWDDHNSSNLDFTQTNASLRLQVSNLWDGKLAASFRTRGRHNLRARSYSSSAPESDWDNNIYEFSLLYGAEDDAFHLHAGRIAPRRVSGLGRFDGALIEQVFSRLVIGAFAGAEPAWQYHSRDAALHKMGGYAGYTAGSRRATNVDLTLAAIAEYHASTVSREFLYTQGRFNIGSRLNISHTAEIDINRSWRKTNAGETFSVSSLYLYARWQVTHGLAASVNFDNRKTPWTYDTRDVADSLFDDNLRQGLRGRLDVNLPFRVVGQVGAGVRDRGDDLKPTHTYTAGLRQSGAILRGLSLRANVSNFEGDSEHGHNTNFNITQSFPHQVSIGLGYSTYYYSLGPDETARDNHRTDLSVRFPIKRRLRFDTSIQFESGDDTKGNRLDAGLYYQF